MRPVGVPEVQEAGTVFRCQSSRWQVKMDLFFVHVIVEIKRRDDGYSGRRACDATWWRSCFLPYVYKEDKTTTTLVRTPSRQFQAEASQPCVAHQMENKTKKGMSHYNKYSDCNKRMDTVVSYVVNNASCSYYSVASF